jgi:excisionase family DNA binding protein
MPRSCGHFASKSRRFSTTLGAIRRERRTYRQRQAAEHVRELLDEDTTLVISHWEFAGTGYLTTGDAALALSAAARAREQRQAVRYACHERMHTYPEGTNAMIGDVVQLSRRPNDSKSVGASPRIIPAQRERAVYSVREVSQMLSISLGGTYQLCRNGMIPALKLGVRWVVPKARFHTWLDNLPIADPKDE